MRDFWGGWKLSCSDTVRPPGFQRRAPWLTKWECILTPECGSVCGGRRGGVGSLSCHPAVHQLGRRRGKATVTQAGIMWVKGRNPNQLCYLVAA